MRVLGRRAASLAALVSACVLAGALAAVAAEKPTGRELGGLGAFDEAMEALMRRWDIPGGALAVAYEGRLLLARGYGWADLERRERVQPTSLFRMASLSKTVTAVAVLQLVQAGKLGLDDKVVPLLGELGPRPGKVKDRRVLDVTVRQLLQHTAGWDRGKSGDAVFAPYAVASAKRLGAAMPPDCPTVMRDAFERGLDFAPGARYAYSNLGYCILGRVVERVSGAPYESYVRDHILIPAGVTRMQVGHTLQATEGEVRYYDWEQKEYPAMPGLGPTRAPRTYGEFALETMDSYGGWIASPVDYLRFLLAIDGRRGGPLLDAATLKQMHAPPGAAAKGDGGEDALPSGTWYGLGVNVRPVRGGLNLWHFGSLPGTSTLALRTAEGATWVVAFNRRPRERAAFRGETDRALWAGRNQVKGWPNGDLFGSF